MKIQPTFALLLGVAVTGVAFAQSTLNERDDPLARSLPSKPATVARSAPLPGAATVSRSKPQSGAVGQPAKVLEAGKGPAVSPPANGAPILAAAAPNLGNNVTAPPSPLPAGQPIPAVQDPPGSVPVAKLDDERSKTFSDPFERAYRDQNPFTPDQLIELTRREARLQAAKDYRDPTVNTTVNIPVSLRPGLAPAVIETVPGNTTGITVTDITGRPWPISTATVGDGNLFTLSLPDKPTNYLEIVPNPARISGVTNLLVLLDGAQAPLALTVRLGTTISYYFASLNVDDRGPNAQEVAVTDRLEPATDPIMRAILDGAGPVTDGVEVIEVTGGPATAFRVGEHVYLRTALNLIVPAYIAKLAGNGISVYEIPLSDQIVASDSTGMKRSLVFSEKALIDAAFRRGRPYPQETPAETLRRHSELFGDQQ